MKIIKPVVPTGAKILVIGEAPGHYEEQLGRPFVGASGQLLFDRLLGRVGIHRSDCAITNVCLIKPPGNSMDRLYQLGLSKDAFIEDMWQLIRSKHWDMIVPVGEIALNEVCGVSSITRWHGSFLLVNECRCVPLIHPAAILRQWDWYEWTLMDCFKIKYILDTGVMAPPEQELITYATHPVAGFMAEYIEGLHKAPFVAFDLETFKGTITALSLAGCANESISIPFTDNQFSLTDQRELVRCIQSLMASRTPKVAQNGSYDITYLREWGVEVRSFWLDTMLAHHSIHPELPHSLAFLCNQYTLQQFYKDMRKETATINYSESAWNYSALDACITWEVANKLGKELVRTKVFSFYQSHISPLFGAICRMQLRGIKIDQRAITVHLDRLNNDLTKLRRASYTLTDSETFNANSYQQVRNLLYTKLGIPPIIDRRTGKETSSEISLRTIMRTHPRYSPIIKNILDIRGNVKLSGFLQAEQEADGRMRTFYNISGTVTGRLSSGENIWGRGTNLQNIPKSIRDIFVPDDGFILWQADGMQAEDRVVAFMSGEPVLIRSYEQGLDTHSVMASILFDVPYQEIVDGRKAGDKRLTLLRETAKRVRHGWNYGMGARRLAEVIAVEIPEMDWTTEMSNRSFAKLEQGLPKVVEWRKQGIEWLKEKRVWYSPFGRRRKFTGRPGEDLHKEFFANGPQGMVGDHINRCIAPIERRLHELYNQLDNTGVSRAEVTTGHKPLPLGNMSRDHELGMPLLQVHDAIVGQCRPGLAEFVKGIVQTEMERPLPIERDGKPLIIPCEFKVGKNWKEV